ncbi:pantoate--beta-alanine ligase [Salipaludibacillus keqinensis]|uniref:Pantothenate synthetase n=1 Tax=Salipaludibacillus keqinensis TaxID=2045207 RepID=A0A323THE1_9BACI|nr:pantoate--beta-alanine ligase [Salipaludibacillus keqinensis]PYZ94542.1 pantoate--beta-alanine ligase [Salipaludibacillus keqinensis]
MIEINTIKEMKQWVLSRKKEGQTVGFVPTMGFLHEGHLSLVKKAKSESDVVIMSVFVNPLQFGEGEDFEEYPRNKHRDEDLAKDHGVDVLFYPDAKEMYPGPMSVSMKVHHGVDVLCGASRPGHFDGVATVVMKLFQITDPDKAFFGMKDAQQVAVIQNMVRDFHLDVDVVPVDIVREEDGLAKSSRNVNLSESERKEAHHLSKTLNQAKVEVVEGRISTSKALEAWTRKELAQRITGKLDYVQVLRFPDLMELTDLQGKIILAVAVFYDRARIIDNITWEIGKGEFNHVS